MSGPRPAPNATLERPFEHSSPMLAHSLRPLRPTRLVPLLALAWLASSLVPAAPQRQEATATPGCVQVVLVRHAEKAAEPGPDPALSQAGLERAERLAALFAPSGATRFFASQFQRTQATLAGWAAAADAEVEVHDARDPAGLVERLRALEPGTVAAVAGHSNTVPDLLRRLSGTVADLDARGFLHDDAYGRVFVLTVPVGAAPEDLPPTAVLELAY